MSNLSPEPVAHLSQHKLLPLLLQRAQATAGTDSIRFGHRLQDFNQNSDGIHCHVQPLQVGFDPACTDGTQTVSKYLMLALEQH